MFNRGRKIVTKVVVSADAQLQQRFEEKEREKRREKEKEKEREKPGPRPSEWDYLTTVVQQNRVAQRKVCCRRKARKVGSDPVNPPPPPPLHPLSPPWSRPLSPFLPLPSSPFPLVPPPHIPPLTLFPLPLPAPLFCAQPLQLQAIGGTFGQPGEASGEAQPLPAPHTESSPAAAVAPAAPGGKAEEDLSNSGDVQSYTQHAQRPGFVQSHGSLLFLEERSYKFLGVADNIFDFFDQPDGGNGERKAGEEREEEPEEGTGEGGREEAEGGGGKGGAVNSLLGQSCSCLMTEQTFACLVAACESSDPQLSNPILIKTVKRARPLYAIVHRSDEGLPAPSRPLYAIVHRSDEGRVVDTERGPRPLYAIVHRTDEGLVVDVEPCVSSPLSPPPPLHKTPRSPTPITARPLYAIVHRTDEGLVVDVEPCVGGEEWAQRWKKKGGKAAARASEARGKVEGGSVGEPGGKARSGIVDASGSGGEARDGEAKDGAESWRCLNGFVKGEGDESRQNQGEKGEKREGEEKKGEEEEKGEEEKKGEEEEDEEEEDEEEEEEEEEEVDMSMLDWSALDKHERTSASIAKLQDIDDDMPKLCDTLVQVCARRKGTMTCPSSVTRSCRLVRSDHLRVLLPKSAQEASLVFSPSFHSLQSASIAKLQDIDNDMPRLCDALVQELRELAGYDRVLLYRFDEDLAAARAGRELRELAGYDRVLLYRFHENLSCVSSQGKSAAVLIPRGVGERELRAARAGRELRELAGYDRVLLYRFHEDLHGEVVAEAKSDAQASLLGLHYPATDCPQVNRTMFVDVRLRLIADVTAPDVHIIQHPSLSKNINLSKSTLKGVSSCHKEYCASIGIGASLVMAVVAFALQLAMELEAAEHAAEWLTSDCPPSLPLSSPHLPHSSPGLRPAARHGARGSGACSGATLLNVLNLIPSISIHLPHYQAFSLQLAMELEAAEHAAERLTSDCFRPAARHGARGSGACSGATRLSDRPSSLLTAPHSPRPLSLHHQAFALQLAMELEAAEHAVERSNPFKLLDLTVSTSCLPTRPSHHQAFALQLAMELEAAFALQLAMELEAAEHAVERRTMQMQAILCGMLSRDVPLGLVPSIGAVLLWATVVPFAPTPSVPHSLCPSLPPSLPPSVPHSLRPSVLPSLTPSDPHSSLLPSPLTTSLSPSLTPSLPPSLTPSLTLPEVPLDRAVLLMAAVVTTSAIGRGGAAACGQGVVTTSQHKSTPSPPRPPPGAIGRGGAAACGQGVVGAIGRGGAAACGQGVVPSDGAVLLHAGRAWWVGACPAEEDMKEIARWLRLKDTHLLQHTVFVTNSLEQAGLPFASRLAPAVCGLAAAMVSSRGDFLMWFRSDTHLLQHTVFVTNSLEQAGLPFASRLAPAVCGLAAAMVSSRGDFLMWFRSAVCGLAATMVSSRGDSLMWFRPGIERNITWAGHKDSHTVREGATMHPRNSFAAYLEVVKLQSQPWTDAEVDAMQGLRLIVKDSLPHPEPQDLKLKIQAQLNAERLTIQSQLKEVARTLENQLESAHTPIIGISSDGTVTEFNSKAAHITRRAKSEVLGSNFFSSVLAPESHAHFVAAMEVLAEGDDVQPFDVALLARSADSVDAAAAASAAAAAGAAAAGGGAGGAGGGGGKGGGVVGELDRLVHVLVSAYGQHDRHGNLMSVRLMGQDITALKVLAGEVRKARERGKAGDVQRDGQRDSRIQRGAWLAVW
ncbi:unnamed protein product [Closterium sp. Naga37s-1]|nr:unnamed protein product [Closterium sp. Naga37s-1]